VDLRQTQERLRRELVPLIESCGLELVDLNFFQRGSKINLRLFVDKPAGGINVEECASLNETIGRFLDERDIIQQSFILEVSSPGLDRPLTSVRDFMRAKEKKVKVFLRQPFQEKRELEGKIKDVGASSISLEVTDTKQIVKINLQEIIKARQVI
jgi:ribosome maturation factor RimP